MHCASLIIDDLPCMDNNSIRRARPAADVRHGEAVAILSAFALMVLSIRLVDGIPSQCEQIRLFKTMLLNAVGNQGLIAGQELDLRRVTGSQEHYIKTSPLFELACAAGIVGSHIHHSVRALLLEFGRVDGSAFQAADDLADEKITPESVDRQADCASLLATLCAKDPRYRNLELFLDLLKHEERCLQT